MLNFNSNSAISISLPPQMINLSDKLADDGKWGKDTMDAFEQIAKLQYNENLNLLENYEMIKGRFFYKHYVGDAGYQDMIQVLSQEFSIPSYLRHYDFISPIINTLSGEYQKRPDVFRVRDFSEKGTNEFKRKKTELLSKYISTKLMQEINLKLMEMGLKLDAKFNSEEEQQAYQQMLDKTIKMMTPPEIEMYMKTDYLTSAEIWGQHQLEYDKERFRMAEKEKVEFEDMLISDRAFRHFYLTKTDYNQETCNPITTFFEKSPDVVNIEESNYVGRVFVASIADIIDRYGHLMKKSEIESLNKFVYKRDKKWDYSKGSEYVYQNYLQPFQGYKGYSIANSFNNIETEGVPYLNSEFFNKVIGNSIFNEKNGYAYVIEAYWKSHSKQGLVTFIDPNTGVLRQVVVDESFVVPDGFKELDAALVDEPEANTVLWTYINQIWKGKKICLKSFNSNLDDIYLDIKPNDFQNEGKLPVVGNIFSVRNSKSMSLVDLVKPFQIGFNLCINQAYQFAEKEIGSFMVFDVNMLMNSKDWGGEDSWDKWMLIAKSMGMLPVDTSPQNSRMSLAASGGQLPKIIDLDFASRMMSRINLANFFKQLALEQVGFNQFRLGTFTNRDTATGIEAGQQQSYAQTESYFTNFSNYLKRVYETNLEISKYVQSKKPSTELLMTKSDLSRAFISVTPDDLSYTKLGCHITNSQEYLRQLETLRQIGMGNNTSGASMYDLATMVVSNSPSEIMNKLKQSDEYKRQLQEQQMAMQQDQLKQQADMKKFEEDRKDQRIAAELDSKEKIAELQYANKEIPDNSMSDALKSRALDQKELFHKDTMDQNMQLKQRELALKEKKINADIQNQNKKVEAVRVLKDEEL